jgi:hypothetical protein
VWVSHVYATFYILSFTFTTVMLAYLFTIHGTLAHALALAVRQYVLLQSTSPHFLLLYVMSI